MRSSEEVQANITSVCIQIKELQEQLPLLRKEMEASRKIENKQEILLAINHLGIGLAKARWKSRGRASMSSPSSVHMQTTTDTFTLALRYEGIVLNATLGQFVNGEWALEYALSQYGASIRADDFRGDAQAAKKWAKAQLELKLTNIKKQLMKDLKDFL